jgi:hypothetical protein
MLSQYEGASPKAISNGSVAQMLHFVEDAKHDIALLASTLDRANRNREMWQGQCARQAEELTRLRKELAKVKAASRELIDALTSEGKAKLRFDELSEARADSDTLHAADEKHSDVIVDVMEAIVRVRAALGDASNAE